MAVKAASQTMEMMKLTRRKSASFQLPRPAYCSEKGRFLRSDSKIAAVRPRSTMVRSAASVSPWSRKPRHRASAPNRIKLTPSNRRNWGRSTKSRMVMTKAAVKAAHKARSAERRDSRAKRMNGAKPRTRFMASSLRKEKAEHAKLARPAFHVTSFRGGVCRRSCGDRRVLFDLHIIHPQLHDARRGRSAAGHGAEAGQGVINFGF